MMTQNINGEDYFKFLNIGTSFIAIAMILMVLINTNPLFYVEFFENNLTFAKVLGAIIIIKAYNFYSLLLSIGNL